MNRKRTNKDTILDCAFVATAFAVFYMVMWLIYLLK